MKSPFGLATTLIRIVSPSFVVVSSTGGGWGLVVAEAEVVGVIVTTALEVTPVEVTWGTKLTLTEEPGWRGANPGCGGNGGGMGRRPLQLNAGIIPGRARNWDGY